MDAWNDNTLSYLDVLRDVYSSLSFPGFPATEGVEDADPVMAGMTGQQQVGKEERKMGRVWEEASGFETAQQYSALHHEHKAGEEGEGGEYIGGDREGDVDEEESETEVGKGGKSPRAQHRRQYRNRKYRRLSQNPSSEVLDTVMSSSNSNSSLLLSNDTSSTNGRRSRSNSMGMVGEEEIEEKGRAATVMPVGGVHHPGRVGLGKGKQFLVRPPLSPASSPKHSSSSSGTSTSSNSHSKCTPHTRSKRGGSSTNSNGSAAAASASSSSGSTTRNRRRAALKAEEAIHRAQGGREGTNEGGSEEEEANRRSSRGGGGWRRKPGDDEDEDEDEDEDGGEGELDEALMNLRFPAQHETDFVGAVFKLGLKCSSPKVLMDLMPMTETLTTEHIKSHLQKYRLHGNRSKDEFVEYFNGYMRGPFASFCARREWEHERGSEGATGGGVEGILPPLFAHGHRRLPLPMSGGSRQHHLQQVQMLTVGGKGRAGGREGGRERGSVRC
ncbi:hypothetical protein VYU27_008899 [Nannochloropsis oceanica]